jgi:hypothetical protein
MSGCLITESTQLVGPTNTPPSISTSAVDTHPLDQIVNVTLDSMMTGADAGAPMTEIEFTATVLDPDVADDLAYEVWVDYNAARPNPVPAAVGTVPTVAMGDRARRPTGFALPIASLTEGCHHVELLVSGGFQGLTRAPRREGDLGAAVWWVAVHRGTDPVDMLGCQ